jgi:prepilin-type N-terminal cleavage/methylation domain-containing protein
MSLVELLVVLVVLGVIAAIAVPRFAVAADRIALDAAASRLANELSLVRDRAVRTETAALIELDDVARAVLVKGVDRAGTSWSGGTIDLGGAPYAIDAITMKLDGDTVMRIDASGLATARATFTIWRGDHARTIRFERTGAARWY